MNEKVRFTDEEENELRLAMKNGGIFLKIYSNPDFKVEVQAADGNGGWKTVQTLNRIISDKICALYNSQSNYKEPLEAGFRKISLAWLIATYC